MEIVLVGPTNVALQESPRRDDPEEPVDRQVHTLRQRGLDQPLS